MAAAAAVFVSLDCADPEPLGQFWAALLDGELALWPSGTAIVTTAWVTLAAVRIPDHRPPTWPVSEVPKQIHLDVRVADLDEAEADAVRLGALAALEQPAPDRRRVLFDPAGHPFCLIV